MGRYTRKCKGSEEMAVMEEAEETGGRKRKVHFGESTSVQVKTRRLSTPDNSASPASSESSTCESVNLDLVLSACCSSSGSTELANWRSKVSDLEFGNEVSAEIFATSVDDPMEFRDREKTPSSEVLAEPGMLESTVRRGGQNFRGRSTAEKMPFEAEIEEFFAAAEKNLQKEFIDKYNYDIAKDEPLEGRYEWVKIQTKP